MKTVKCTTSNYVVYITNGKVTLAKSLKTGKFIKLSLAQAEYDLVAVEKTNSATVKNSMLELLADYLSVIIFALSVVVAVCAFFNSDTLLYAFAIMTAIACVGAEVTALECISFNQKGSV